MIGHTQPRRIAARSVAERIAEELGTELGDVGRLPGPVHRPTSKQSRVKVMTDGILLAELQHDRDLQRYDTLIIDEAHERSLNIDFLLGYLKRLLPRRPDLKVVITSATIDPERFAAALRRRAGTPAPIIEVSGRTYPVEVRYRPLVEEPDDDEEGEPVQRDQTEAIVAAVDELIADTDGDILVFLPGRAGDPRHRRRARSSRAEGPPRLRHRPAVLAALRRRAAPGLRAAHPPPGRARHQRRRDLADGPGHHRGHRHRRGPDQPVLGRAPRCSGCRSSRSARPRRTSARAGAAGSRPASRSGSTPRRTSRAGPEFTEPEILRTTLASVILQMTSLGLGEVDRFPFVDPPDAAHVRAGVQLLEELGALGARTTATGRG